LLTRAVLVADITAYNRPSTPWNSHIGHLLSAFFSDPVACKSISSPFQTVRREMAAIIGTMHASKACRDVNCALLADRLQSLLASSAAISSSEHAQQVSKAVIDVAGAWLYSMLHYLTERNIITPANVDVIGNLFSMICEGAGHADLDFAKSCHSWVLRTVQTVMLAVRTTQIDLINKFLNVMIRHLSHESWHTRETMNLAMIVYLGSNWSVLSNEEKKTAKDSIVEALFDVKPEVQMLAMKAMIVYLMTKANSELSTIAASYTRNCDTLATRLAKPFHDFKILFHYIII
jgi:hypothetical protein